MPDINLCKDELAYEQNIIKVLEQNIKLEDEMAKMKEFSQENEKLRDELVTAKHRLSSHQKEVINDKDKKIEELAKTLSDRENMYKSLISELSNLKSKMSADNREQFDKMMHDKEEELEKINHINSTYRAQLIEFKISMSKTRDLGRFLEKKDQHEIVVENSEIKFEEAKEKVINLEDKVREQNSIIETLLSQVDYYKTKYETNPQK